MAAEEAAVAGMAAEEAAAGMAAAEGAAAEGAAAEGTAGAAEADGTSRDIPCARSAGKGTTSHSEIAFSYLLPYTVGDCWGDTSPPLRFGP